MFGMNGSLFEVLYFSLPTNWKDIRSRMARTKNAFSNRKELLTKFFSLDLKKRIVKTVIWSTLLYGAESWALRRDDIQRLESSEMWLWRKILNISWSDKVSNDEVLRRVEEEKPPLIRDKELGRDTRYVTAICSLL